MELENMQPQAVAQNPSFKVSSLLKYIAFGLFAILLALGGFWVGMTFGSVAETQPTSTTETENSGAADAHLSIATDQKIASGQRMHLFSTDATKYVISLETLKDGNWITEEEYQRYSHDIDVTKIDRTHTLVSLSVDASDGGWMRTFLVDEPSSTVIREIKPGLKLNDIDLWEQKGSSTVRIAIERFTEGTEMHSRVVAYDYINDRSEILYEEVEEDIALAEICEFVCFGLLYSTDDIGTVIVGRYKKNSGTTLNTFVETLSLQGPQTL